MIPALESSTAEETINSVLDQARILVNASASVDNVDRAGEMVTDIGHVLAIYDAEIDRHDAEYSTVSTEDLGWRWQLNALRSQLQKKIEDFQPTSYAPRSESAAFFGSLGTDASEFVDTTATKLASGLQNLGIGLGKTAEEAAAEGLKLTATIRTVLIILAVAIGLAAVVGAYVYLGNL